MTATRSAPAGFVRPRTALIVACIALFTDMLIYGVAIPVLPLLPATVHAGHAATGALFASYAMAMVAVTVPAGRLVDRFGARQPLLLGLVALATATALFAVGTPFGVLVLARILQGAAAGLSWVAGLSLIAAVTPFKSRGRAMGVAMAMVSMGVLIGPPVSGALVQAWGTRAPFLVGAALALADGAVRVVCVRGSERVTDDVAGPMSVVRVKGTPSVLGVVMIGALSIAALEPVLPLQLVGRHHLTSFGIGLLFALMVATSAVASPVVGGWVARVDARYLVLAGGALATASCLGIATSRPTWGIAVAMAGMGISNPLFLAPASALIGQQGERASPPTMGGAYAAFNLAYAGGLMVGPLVAGAGESLTSFPVTLGALALLVAVGAGAAVPRLPSGGRKPPKAAEVVGPMPAEVTRTHPTSDVMPESPIVTCDNTDTQPLMAQTTAPAQPAPARSVPEPAAGLPSAAAALERSVRRPMAEPSARVRSWPDIDVRQLRHPSEPSRFAFSASASLLLLGLGLLLTLRLGGIRWLVGITALVPVALGSLWCLVQAYRARLLGGAARVTPEMFPELSAAASKLERQLGYTPVEMFVTANVGDQVLLTSFLGTHVLLMNGDLVAELVKPGNRPQLDFVLATFFGKLEVKALAWAPARVAIDVLRLPRVLNVLIAPWERATVYSGDQVAAACCGSLDESVIALNRLLVGKDLAPSVGMTGLMSQAVSVRQRWLPRLQEICSSSPHMASRYLNLLSFAGQTAPEQARAFREGLKHRTGLKVRDALARSARLRSRRRRRGLLPVSLGTSIVLLGVAALGMFPSVPQHLVAALQKAPRTPSAAAATPRVAATAFSVAPSVSSAFPDTPTDAVTGLESHVPPAFAGTCIPFTPQPAMTGLVAAIACTPSGSGVPARVQYYRFANATGMNAVFNHAASGVTESGTCDQGGQRGTYHFAGGPVSGMWACYYTAGNTGQLIWTRTNLGIMALANDPSQTPQQLSNWFFSSAATGPE